MAKNNITGHITMAFVMSLLFGCSTYKKRADYASFYPLREFERFSFIFEGDIVERDYIVEDEGINSGYFLWRSDLIDTHGSNAIDSAINIKINIFTPISDVKKEFRLDEKAMYKNRTRVDSFLVRFAEYEDNFATVRFFFQLKGIGYYNSKYKYRSWKRIHFIEDNVYEISFNHPERIRRKIDKLEFNNGSGVWRDYYFLTSPVDKFVLKEKGRIKNNYKVGKWKYYDKEGNLTHTRQYKKSEKVDVRFPYCIWNEVEPCYCDE